jgi:O-antigen ligase
MNKIYPYIVSIIIAFFAIIPPIGFKISTPDMFIWTGLIVATGFLGTLLLVVQKNIFIKILALGGFINCFFSVCPEISFTSYISLIACCYFYILCSKVKDWTIVFKTIFTVLLFECIFVSIQILDKDVLLNFGVGGKLCFGTIGNRMQFNSFIVILSAILIQKFNWKVICGIISVFILYTIIACRGNELSHIHTSFLVRLPVWKQAIVMSLQHPFTGWGLSSFKVVFPGLSGLGATFAHAHSDWIQNLFETGVPGLLFMISGFGILIRRAMKSKEVLIIIGLCMIAIDMTVHFPLRMIQTVPLIIMFIAYCNFKERGLA